jgi:hypothetical protein
MHPDNEKLIDYLDKLLDQEKSADLESTLQKDPAIAQEHQYLLLAVDTIRLDAINQKVLSVRHSFENTTVANKPTPAVVRNFYTIGLRIAASIIVLLGISILYKYASVTSHSVYEKQFMAYELSNSRGQYTHNAEEESYQNKKWNEVISIYQSTINPSNKQTFLAAMADMQLNHFPQAVSLFENILNAKSGDNTYQEEAEYYSFLAYLMNHEEMKAIQMINKIKSNPNHTYYPFVSGISNIDLKVIELKN